MASCSSCSSSVSSKVVAWIESVMGLLTPFEWVEIILGYQGGYLRTRAGGFPFVVEPCWYWELRYSIEISVKLDIRRWNWMKLGRDGGITQSGKSGIRRTIIGIDGSKRSVCISFSRGGSCWTFEQAWVSCRQ
jgi:hypothetical protein